MDKVLSNLEAIEIISNKNVIDLKKYIEKKYPDAASSKRALIFADSVNKIIDGNVLSFEEQHRVEIRKGVLKSAIGRNDFKINCSDIAEQCFSMGITDEAYIDRLANWINARQSIVVTKEGIKEHINKKVIYDESKNLEQNIKENLTIVVTKEIDTKFDDIIPGKQHEDIETKNVLPSNEEKKKRAIFLKSLNKVDIFKRIKLQKDVRAKATVILLMIVCTLSLRSALGNFTYVTSKSKKEVVKIDEKDRNDINNKSELYVKRNEKDRKNLDNKGELNVKENEKNKKNIDDEAELYVKRNELAKKYRYREIDKSALKAYLSTKDSLLAKDKYLQELLYAAQKFDVNPLLFIAITGQEQTFVPSANKYSKKIANNPFNVYGSWKKFNTNISEASIIAAKTIINLGRNKPEGVNQIKWINRLYAEDKNWWIGVNSIFEYLNKSIKSNK